MKAPQRSLIIFLTLMVLWAGASLCAKPLAPYAKPLNKAQVLGLARGGVADRRLAALVKERGINFSPTPEYLAELREAGAGQNLIKTLRLAALRPAEPRTVPTAETSGETESGESAFISEAHTLTEEGKWAQAADEYQAALALEPNNPSTLNDLGVALAKTGDLNGALQSYRKAVTLSPGLAAVHDNLGVALQKKGDAAAALAEFRAAVAAEPNDVQAHSNLGLALESRGDLAGALRQYQTALRLDRGSYEAQYNVARALEESGDFDGAIAAFQRTVAQKPDDAMAHFGLGTALEGRGDHRAALEQYRQAQRLAPVNSVIAMACAKLKRAADKAEAGSN